VKQSLADVGFGSQDPGAAVDLLSTFAGHAPDLQGWVKEAIDNGNINTDANLRLQYLAGMWLNTYDETAIFQDILRYYRFPRDSFTGAGAAGLERALENEGRTRFVSGGTFPIQPMTANNP
jgi:spermidine synthase